MEKGDFTTIFLVVDTNTSPDRFNFTDGPAFTTRTQAEQYIQQIRLGTLCAGDVRRIDDEFGQRAWEYKVMGRWGGHARVEPVTLFDAASIAKSKK